MTTPEHALGKALGKTADEELHADIVSLGHEFVAEARALLRRGSPMVRTNLIRTVVAPMIRQALVEDDGAQDKAMAAMREQLDALHEKVRAGIGTTPAAPTEWDGPPVDSPMAG